MYKRNYMRSVVVAGLVSLAAVATPARADDAAPEAWWGGIAGSVAGMSDYVFRGLSQTRGQPAAQLALEYTHSLPFGGLTFYAGTFYSNTRFVDTSSNKNLPIRMEQDLDAGLRGDVPFVENLTWDIGYIRYRYPWANSMPLANNPSPDWTEGYLKLDYDAGFAKFHGQGYHSEKYNTEGGPANYLSFGTDVPLPILDLTASGHVGHLQLDNGANTGYHSYTDWSLGINRDMPELLGVNISLTYYDTDLSKSSTTAASLGLSTDAYDRIHETGDSRLVLAVTKTF